MTLTDQEWNELMRWINGGNLNEQDDRDIEHANLMNELDHNQ